MKIRFHNEIETEKNWNIIFATDRIASDDRFNNRRKYLSISQFCSCDDCFFDGCEMFFRFFMNAVQRKFHDFDDWIFFSFPSFCFRCFNRMRHCFDVLFSIVMKMHLWNYLFICSTIFGFGKIFSRIWFLTNCLINILRVFACGSDRNHVLWMLLADMHSRFLSVLKEVY